MDAAVLLLLPAMPTAVEGSLLLRRRSRRMSVDHQEGARMVRYWDDDAPCMMMVALAEMKLHPLLFFLSVHWCRDRRGLEKNDVLLFTSVLLSWANESTANTRIYCQNNDTVVQIMIRPKDFLGNAGS